LILAQTTLSSHVKLRTKEAGFYRCLNHVLYIVCRWGYLIKQIYWRSNWLVIVVDLLSVLT